MFGNHLTTATAATTATTATITNNNSSKHKVVQGLKVLTRDVTDLALESVQEWKDAMVHQILYVSHHASHRTIQTMNQLHKIHVTFTTTVQQTRQTIISTYSWLYNHYYYDNPSLHRGEGAVGSIVGSILLLLLLLRWYYFKRHPKVKTLQQTQQQQQQQQTQQQQRSRLDSTTNEISGRVRDRKASMDDLFSQSKNTTQITSVVGPNVTSINYNTWTPPLQWKEASKRLLPTSTKPNPQATVTLQIPHGVIIIQQLMEITCDISTVTIAIQRPVESGIVEIVITNNQTTIEHTFDSAYHAAQFQNDILGYQIVGTQLVKLYHALEMIHKGSMAHIGHEPILHGIHCDTEFQQGAVAWDDVMRSLGGMTTIRAALDRIQEETNNESTALPTLHPEYQNKRTLLGHVDFFRLFVPVLPETTLPQIDSLQSRMELLLQLRKRVAEAAVLVQGYVMAKTVVNQGWNPWPEQTKIRQRMALDDNLQNLNRDHVSRNDYYEATVGRDVHCDVHTPQHLITPGASQLSSYQAFALVSCQVFQLPKEGRSHLFSHTLDPVKALPSLNKIISNNPDLEFFVSVFFPEGPRFAIVKLFVRSLPKSVDPSFEVIWKKFKTGDRGFRDRRLELFIQLGPGSNLSPIVRAALKAASYFLSWSRRREPSIPFDSGGDRTIFPGMTMSKYIETNHFGGSLQTDIDMPGNYVSVTSQVNSSLMNMVFRVLYQKLEVGALPSSIVDFTFVLEGEQAEELPERALGTIRMVRINPMTSALPVECSAEQLQPTEKEFLRRCSITPLRKIQSVDVPEGHQVTSYQERTNFVLSPVNDALTRTLQSLNSIRGPMSSWNIFSFQNIEEESNDDFEELSTDDISVDGLEKDDPFKSGVDALADVLDGVEIPVRRIGLTARERAYASPISDDLHHCLPTTIKKSDLCNLAINKKFSNLDLKRYYLAAECDLQNAAVRVIASMAWRGLLFPIDTRECRIELQSGQFFQQGMDRCGNPVFYFQTMCFGPWRKIEDAVINAVLHRLETSIQHYSETKPDVQCTVVIIVGKPLFRGKTQKGKKKGKKKKVFGDDTSTKKTTDDAESMDQHDDENCDDETTQVATTDGESKLTAWNPFQLGINPRLHPGEEYYTHVSTKMIAKLIDTLSKHYPERLHKAICIPGKGGYRYHRNVPNAVGVMMSLTKYIQSARTRAKVTCLQSVDELKEYISADEMVTLVGGNVPVHPYAFEC